MLLEGAETYGLGSWADIADHIGGYRTKDEVRDHYINTYIHSSNFPLPERASPNDTRLTEEIPREEFQSRKKRRIEDRKEAAKNAAPTTPKQKPTASVPACHEVQGYMPGRLEFEVEAYNEAEEAVQHMQFDPGDGINPRTGELEPEMELKVKIMEIYNNKLTARVERKKIVFEHNLLEYRKHQTVDKKRSKEERDIYNKAKPFARMMRNEDFEQFEKDLEMEYNLRLALQQLSEWRKMRVPDIKAGEKYEAEKANRSARSQPLGAAFDRLATNRVKAAPPSEPSTAVAQLVAPDLPLRIQNGLYTPPNSASPSDRQNQRPKFICAPLPSVVPLKLSSENAADLHLLTPDEREVCSTLRLMPKAYIAIKDAVIKEAQKQGGALKKKVVRDVCRIDANKGSRLFDFFVHSGWIGRA